MAGYHHSVISRLESGLREPPWALVLLLDSVLHTGGDLAAAFTAPPEPDPGHVPAGGGLFAVLPDGAAPGAVVPDAVLWPVTLPAEGIPCPAHGTVGCAVPPRPDVLAALRELTAPHGDFVALAARETDLLHALAAALAGLVRGALYDPGTTGGPAAVEGLLRAVIRWARAVDAAGRAPLRQFRMAAQYAQVAGRLRMRRGQGRIAMAWLAHGLRWAEAAADAPARATLLSDICALVRLDGDPDLTLGHARAIGAVDGRRRWAGTLSHLYQARGHALAGDAAACRRHIDLAREGLSALGPRDHAEAPWLAGYEGEMRVESAAGAALRDLAAATGDRTTALRAVDAVARSRDWLPPGMRDTRLLLTLRLADGWACAGDPEAAVALAAPALDEAARSREVLVCAELGALNRRLSAGWGGHPQVRGHHERLLAAGAGGLPLCASPEHPR